MYILLFLHIHMKKSTKKGWLEKLRSKVLKKPEKEPKCTSIWRMLGYEIIIVFLAIILINVYVLSFSVLQYFSHIKDMEPTEVGMVFGASVRPDGTPSKILQDRLNTAVIFYKQDKIQKILVSGDNSSHHYNEPVAMKNFLLEMWIPKEDIYLDYAGFDTYDSLYRARDIFGVDELVIFTQGFHLHRAIYIAKRLGIDITGVTTDLSKYRDSNRNSLREVFARVKAFFEVEILRSKPTYLWDSIEIVSDEKKQNLKNDILN